MNRAFFLYHCRLDKSRENTRIWQHSFFSRLARNDAAFAIFDFLPDVSLFIKDIQGRYVKINETMAEMFGLGSSDEIISKTDFDFFQPAIAARYVDEDQRVIASQLPLLNHRNFMPGSDGFPRWFSYSKFPLFDEIPIQSLDGFVTVELSQAVFDKLNAATCGVNPKKDQLIQHVFQN